MWFVTRQHCRLRICCYFGPTNSESETSSLSSFYLRWVGAPGARRSVNHRAPTVVHTHVVHLATQVMEVLKTGQWSTRRRRESGNLLRCGSPPVHVCGEFTSLGWSARPTLPSPELACYRADNKSITLKRTIIITILFIGPMCSWGSMGLSDWASTRPCWNLTDVTQLINIPTQYQVKTF